jgi:hypothetical protein
VEIAAADQGWFMAARADQWCYNVCPYHPDQVPVPSYVPHVSDSPVAMLLPRASIFVSDTCFISPQSAVHSRQRVVDVLFACAIYMCFIVVYINTMTLDVLRLAFAI